MSDLTFGLVTVFLLLKLALLFLYVESELREISSCEFSGDLEGGFLSFTSTFFFTTLDFLTVLGTKSPYIVLLLAAFSSSSLSRFAAMHSAQNVVCFG